MFVLKTTKMPMKLHDWLSANGKTVTWLAGKTGFSISHLYRIGACGTAERLPSIEACVKIAEATDGQVTATDFMPEPKRKRPSQREVSRAA